ncbi:hypothetical protein N8590_02090 [bacterium]|jgi:hypothetical protein|nr:hypothetical protein [bacterium]MDB4731303.1 hypothetical protein [bacterium]MDB4793322.1 hypothetical protein [bacterium]
MMLIYHCTLKLDTGAVVAEDVAVDMRFRERSTKQPDMASLWYGTLIPKVELKISRHDLDMPTSTGGRIQTQCISDESEHAVQTIKFNGIGDRPQIDDTPIHEPATKTCDECGSNFFPPASKMDGLCPECEHYLYGYDNCDHSIVGVSCEK